MSSLTPNERIAKLESQIADMRLEMRVAGAFGVMLLEQTLDQLEGERLLPSETKWEIWARIAEQMDGVRAGSVHLAWGAGGAIPRRAGVIRAAPPKTHREKLRLRMRKPDADQ